MAGTSRRSFLRASALAAAVAGSSAANSLLQTEVKADFPVVIEGISECKTCMNIGQKENGKCPYERRLPSGKCGGAYENSDLNHYNTAYGPRPQGVQIIPPRRRVA